jgi:hypothetical protein
LYQRVEKFGPGLVENIKDRLRSTTARGIPPTVEEQLYVKIHILGGVGDVMQEFRKLGPIGVFELTLEPVISTRDEKEDREKQDKHTSSLLEKSLYACVIM